VYKTDIIKERDQSVKATAKRDHQAQVHFALGCRFHYVDFDAVEVTFSISNVSL
jgi:hypothetical protein